MTRHVRFIALLVTLAIAVLLLAPHTGIHAAVPSRAAPKVVHVTIKSFAFKPLTVTVTPGTKVVWTNKDSTPHTVTSKTGAWPSSGDINPGKSFAHTFTKPGVYVYICALHPFMKAGKVIVTKK